MQDTDMRDFTSSSRKKTVQFQKQNITNPDLRHALKKMAREKLLRIAQAEFNLDTVQARFLQQFISDVNDLTNGNLIAVLSMFRGIVRNMFKEDITIAGNDRSAEDFKVDSIEIQNPEQRRVYMRFTPKTKIQIAGENLWREMD